MRPGWSSNLLIVAYLLLQLLLPIRGLVNDKFATFGEFTWNMYSQTYNCRVAYDLTEPTGREVSIDIKEYFNKSDNAGRVLHRDGLPHFHAWLCQRLRQAGRLGSLSASCECRLGNDQKKQLVAADVDICTADNYGVLRE